MKKNLDELQPFLFTARYMPGAKRGANARRTSLVRKRN